MSPARASHYDWNHVPLEQLTDAISRRVISSEHTMVAQIHLAKGGVVPLHSHHNEQISYVLTGALRFLLGENQDQEVIVRAGEVLTIPPHLPHSAEALEDTLDLDIFNPPRPDWLDGSDTYLRSS